MIHKTSMHTDWCGADVNELLLYRPPVLKLAHFLFQIFQKSNGTQVVVRYLLFVSFIHHLPTTFIPIGIVYL